MTRVRSSACSVLFAVACLALLTAACASAAERQRQLPDVAPDLRKAEIRWADFPTSLDGRTDLSADGWLLYTNIKFNEEKSRFACGKQKSRLGHSAEKVMLRDPVTVEISGYMDAMGKPERPSMTFGGPARATGPKSASVVWVEPGKNPGTIIMTTDASLIQPAAWESVLSQEGKRPDLKLEFADRIRLGGGETVFFLGEGTTYWGATKGTVKILGHDYSNLKGAIMTADGILK
ncbi:MAG: hypothetical protein Q7T82_04785 [Armatimonadota bacterium]|nr:hypothetical protein [Armatimonadota bacterium]